MIDLSDIRLINGDCLEILPAIADCSCDMALVDLPYGCLNKGNKHAAWDKEIDLDTLWEQWKRIVKPNGAIVLFGQGLFSAKLIMSEPKMYRYSLVWDKGRTTGFLNANRAPLRQHEDILVFYRKQPTYNPQKTIGKRNHSRGKGLSSMTNSCYGSFNPKQQSIITDEKFPTSILQFQKKHKDWCHPTEKDVALLEYLIKTYTNEGDCVIDCTMGSGSTMVACANTGRRGIGIELMQEYYDIAVKRVKDAQAQLKLDLAL